VYIFKENKQLDCHIWANQIGAFILFLTKKTSNYTSEIPLETLGLFG
jgi:hypothetical protein